MAQLMLYSVYENESIIPVEEPVADTEPQSNLRILLENAYSTYKVLCVLAAWVLVLRGTD